MSRPATDHAAHRVRQRVGIPKRSVDRLAQEALEKGAPLATFSGRFRRYLDYTRHQGAFPPNIVIWHEHVFIFGGETLVTCWRVPQEFVRAANKANGRSAADLTGARDD